MKYDILCVIYLSHSFIESTFIHNYKNQIILRLNIYFHYKAMYNYHQLVSILFSLPDCMSLNQNLKMTIDVRLYLDLH